LGYVGSAGTWYLFDAFLESFRQLRLVRPNARALILNRGEHDLIREAISLAGIPSDAVELRAADHAEVPFQMARMDATAFFIRPVFSKRASAPTKLAEFLGCGIPCLTNTGVGDMSKILEEAQVGVAISSFDVVSIRAGVAELLTLCEDPGLRFRCRAVAVLHFSLARGVSAYNKIYESFDQLSCPSQ
jgi:glycosyltransferase involved in cell wall biosynthesis